MMTTKKTRSSSPICSCFSASQRCVATVCRTRTGVCVSAAHVQDVTLTLFAIDVFDVDRIRDIEWNASPFDSLVLPEGYKDLILSFVENQLKDGDMFDDVINGKGKSVVISWSQPS